MSNTALRNCRYGSLVSVAIWILSQWNGKDKRRDREPTCQGVRIERRHATCRERGERCRISNANDGFCIEIAL